MIAAVLAILLAVSSAEDIGPQPTMEEFIALAEPALASKMKDPQSVTFKWPYKLAAGPAGYATCGLVDTLNKKAERREVWVSTVVANGRVVNSQWSTVNGMLAWDCKRRVSKGTLVAR